MAVAAKFCTPPAIEPGAHKDNEGHNELLLKRWTCKADWGPGAKIIWGRSIPKILHLMNVLDRLQKKGQGSEQECRDLSKKKLAAGSYLVFLLSFPLGLEGFLLIDSWVSIYDL